MRSGFVVSLRFDWTSSVSPLLRVNVFVASRLGLSAPPAAPLRWGLSLSYSSPGRARVRLSVAWAFFSARRRSREPLLGLVGRRRLGGTAAAASRVRRRSSTAALLRG